MSSRRLLLSSSLALALVACAPPPEVCREGQEPVTQPLAPLGEAGLVRYGHAHNDYEHPRPLEDALAAGFGSVEADVYFAEGRFEVSHYGFGAKGTLESLYLAPLQALVDERGSVHGDGLPFTLWIDLKDRHPELPAALEALLARFPMLTAYTERGVEAGPVSVLLTGDAEMKEAFVRELSPRHAARDSNDFSPDDPPTGAPSGEGWVAYALNWGRYLSWDGSGEMPAAERRRLGCVVETAHDLGRKVRFFAAPDREEVWEVAREAGVDFLHTDRLEALAAFLKAAE